MTRTLLGVAFACVMLTACASRTTGHIADRADNDMLRFSASNYTLLNQAE